MMAGERNYEPKAGPCEGCSRDETCCDHRGKSLCEKCWHAARECETPYAVYRDADGYCLTNGAYTLEEAQDRVQEMRERDEQQLASFEKYASSEDESESIRTHYGMLLAHCRSSTGRLYTSYTVKSCSEWFGERIAHPGYVDRKRSEVAAAAHPESHCPMPPPHSPPCSKNMGCTCSRCSRDRRSLVVLCNSDGVRGLIDYVVFRFRLRDDEIRALEEIVCPRPNARKSVGRTDKETREVGDKDQAARTAR
jgi:hypothetical protein